MTVEVRRRVSGPVEGIGQFFGGACWRTYLAAFLEGVSLAGVFIFSVLIGAREPRRGERAGNGAVKTRGNCDWRMPANRSVPPVSAGLTVLGMTAEREREREGVR